MNTVPFSEQERNMTASQDLRIDWKNVPTRTIAAGEVEFAYRELGPNNPGTPSGVPRPLDLRQSCRVVPAVSVICSRSTDANSGSAGRPEV
jgi:hypothetical protein